MREPCRWFGRIAILVLSIRLFAIGRLIGKDSGSSIRIFMAIIASSIGSRGVVMLVICIMSVGLSWLVVSGMGVVIAVVVVTVVVLVILRTMILIVVSVVTSTIS